MVVIEMYPAYGKVIGGSKDLHNAIQDACKFKVQGAEMSELYRKHRWDGYKKLYNKSTHRFPQGLLGNVLDVIEAHRLKVEIKYMYECPFLDFSSSLPMTGAKLRNYQEEAIEKALEAQRGIIQVATGGGKTVIASGLIAKLNAPTLFMVHTRDLLYQAKSSFEDILGVPIGQIGDGVVDPHQITVATTQSIAMYMGIKCNIEDKTENMTLCGDRSEIVAEVVNNTKLVIWDEVHRIACDMACAVADIINAPYRIGLSASPWRDDGCDMMMHGAIGPVIYRLSASDLISMGYLVKPTIVMQSMTDISTAFEYASIYKQQVVDNKMRNQWIVEKAIKEVGVGRPTLILVKQISHGRTLQKMLKQQWGDVDFLSGKDSSFYRKTTIEKMKEGSIDILIASTIADEGLDIPRIASVILAGGGKSSTKALQRVGRALRLYEGKKEAIIYDIWDQSPYLKEQGLKREEIYKTEKEFEVWRF